MHKAKGVRLTGRFVVALGWCESSKESRGFGIEHKP
jgi:hypothetical protein